MRSKGHPKNTASSCVVIACNSNVIAAIYCILLLPDVGHHLGCLNMLVRLRNGCGRHRTFLNSWGNVACRDLGYAQAAS